MVSFVCTVVMESEIVWIFLLAGIVAWIVKAPPKFLRRPRLPAIFLPLAVTLPTASNETLWKMFLYFTEAGAFVFGVTAAAIGAISGAVIVLGRRTIFGETRTPDVFKIAVMLVTLAILWSGKKFPEPLIVLAAALAGLVAYPLLR